jgi:hypothetical protein
MIICGVEKWDSNLEYEFVAPLCMFFWFHIHWMV